MSKALIVKSSQVNFDARTIAFRRAVSGRGRTPKAFRYVNTLISSDEEADGRSACIVEVLVRAPQKHQQTLKPETPTQHIHGKIGRMENGNYSADVFEHDAFVPKNKEVGSQTMTNKDNIAELGLRTACSVVGNVQEAQEKLVCLVLTKDRFRGTEMKHLSFASKPLVPAYHEVSSGQGRLGRFF
ncbi:hypothetical protein LZ554_003603 [Drepanopeziza brunnea f. sp. 'monogermtubi']|nr:hypothetical protein LZ554_003603 [Drepanopeziza brunnea f. sp. 'monogermtubi']